MHDLTQFYPSVCIYLHSTLPQLCPLVLSPSSSSSSSSPSSLCTEQLSLHNLHNACTTHCCFTQVACFWIQLKLDFSQRQVVTPDTSQASMETSVAFYNKQDETGQEEKQDHHLHHHHHQQHHRHLHHHHQEVDDPCWADMLPDALAKIFSRLSLEDMLTNIPRVCRTWRRASHDAVCWQKVDLDEWSHGRKPETLEKMLVFLMNRSRGCLQEICAPKLNNDNMLRIIAWSGSPLRVLRIPQSIVTEDCMCQLAPHFALITFLDVSGCIFTKASVESFGKHCRMITRLNLNMYPQSSNLAVCDDMAFAIAQYMPQLKHLEMAYGMLSNAGLKAVLEKCKSLEHLDLRGCWQLNIEETFVKEARKRFKVFHPPVVENDIYNTDDSDFDASDFYDDSDYYDEDMWYDSELEDLDDLVMEMHEEEINGTLYFWPDTSPSR